MSTDMALTKLRGDQASLHYHPRTQSRKESSESNLSRDSAESEDHRSSGPFSFVDLGEKGIGRLVLFVLVREDLNDLVERT